ncbi:unnamed protein product [Ectocarpus sp. 12 AP-2014]
MSCLKKKFMKNSHHIKKQHRTRQTHTEKPTPDQSRRLEKKATGMIHDNQPTERKRPHRSPGNKAGCWLLTPQVLGPWIRHLPSPMPPSIQHPLPQRGVVDMRRLTILCKLTTMKGSTNLSHPATPTHHQPEHKGQQSRVPSY